MKFENHKFTYASEPLKYSQENSLWKLYTVNTNHNKSPLLYFRWSTSPPFSPMSCWPYCFSVASHWKGPGRESCSTSPLTSRSCSSPVCGPMPRPRSSTPSARAPAASSLCLATTSSTTTVTRTRLSSALSTVAPACLPGSSSFLSSASWLLRKELALKDVVDGGIINHCTNLKIYIKQRG